MNYDSSMLGANQILPPETPTRPPPGARPSSCPEGGRSVFPEVVFGFAPNTLLGLGSWRPPKPNTTSPAGGPEEGNTGAAMAAQPARPLEEGSPPAH